jgi:hypothetical protein
VTSIPAYYNTELIGVVKRFIVEAKDTNELPIKPNLKPIHTVNWQREYEEIINELLVYVFWFELRSMF